MGFSESDAQRALDSVAFEERESWGVIAILYRHDTGIKVAAAALSAPPSEPRFWAAVEIYVAGGEDLEALRRLMSNPVAAARVQAAAGLVARGEEAGFAELVAALAAPGEPAAGFRPEPPWWLAARALVGHTRMWTNGPPIDADADLVHRAHGVWSEWLERHRGRLTYDAATGEWAV